MADEKEKPRGEDMANKEILKSNIKRTKVETREKKERPAPEWKSTELDFRLAISQAIKHYEMTFMKATERYKKAQLDLEERYRKFQLDIIGELNDLVMMIQTIDAVKDDGRYKPLYETKNGIGYKLNLRECGFKPGGKGIEEKIVSKPE